MDGTLIGNQQSEMRKLLYMLFISACVSANTSQKKLYTVHFHITQSSDWCSGVAPGPETYEQMTRPRDYVGVHVYIKKGPQNHINSKIITEGITDSSGNLSVQLPAGNYILLREDKLKSIVFPKNDEYCTWDSICIKNEWLKGDLSFVVNDSSDKNLILDFRKHCTWSTPCMNYSGPLPP